MKRMAMNGDQAVALSWKQINPDVCASYPITPQTIIVEAFSDFVADGEVDTEYVCTESEHSSMSLCIGASAAGARAVTATASAGLAYMWEVLYIAASMRMPIVMTVANRALSGPINIHCDHSDAMGARDSGWVQIFAENVQEAYDNSIMSFRIAEHMKVRLPVMNCLDGFIVTHAIESLSPIADEDVKKFVGEFKPVMPLLDHKNPHTFGPFDMPEYYYEHKYAQAMAMNNVLSVIDEVHKDFEKLTGRKYDFIETYRTEDADYVAIAIGSTAGTLKQVVDDMRKEGHKVGSIKLRVFRPFPYAAVAKVMEGKKGVAVLDRAISFGACGPLFAEVRSAEFDNRNHPRTVNYVYGLGGRDVGVEDLKQVYRQLETGTAATINYLGVKQ
ncbi:pyruvate ferredoxin oxidoreductase [Methanomassiliicoccus luminyensis]|uniref:pyruvate ferredoxin oxidoreductase n=1 Tax=Methanomassiliicoccus luminyensis TaxID=1080712 RepID=UPI000674D769|nr:pyruvate ferredoxin oxidoreductase [Methanomassiliicoccus luminyensis]